MKPEKASIAVSTLRNSDYRDSEVNVQNSQSKHSHCISTLVIFFKSSAQNLVIALAFINW